MTPLADEMVTRALQKNPDDTTMLEIRAGHSHAGR